MTTNPSVTEPSSHGGATQSIASPATRLLARGLACRRGERLLFMALDLTLHAGELVWLRGANGSGKTSLLKILAGLATPDAGTIERDRNAVRSGDDDMATSPGSLIYIAHANGLKEDLTVAESLHFLLRMNGIASTPASRLEALARIGMANRCNAFVRTLSQGQRKRVTLARLTLASPASVWLLDEPFDALDASGIALLEAMLAAHTARGGGAIVTSHRPLGDALPSPTVMQLGTA